MAFPSTWIRQVVMGGEPAARGKVWSGNSSVTWLGSTWRHYRPVKSVSQFKFINMCQTHAELKQ